jgi:arylsulfatase A-like enzyme
MKRRDFLKTTGAVTGGLLTGLGTATASSLEAVDGPQPNILFFLVDELRYPTVFPDGITTPGEFLRKHMPNLHKLWKAGVKFGNYHTAANACTPARGTLITGLYSQQSWLLTTILSTPAPNPTIVKLEPVLNTHYPTYGKLLRSLGYATPYFGKWHVSIPQQGTRLDAYGFDYYTYPDPTGSNLQGTYGSDLYPTQPPPPDKTYLSDADVATAAIQFMQGFKPNDAPWCMTVSFVNPHDREFFPAGTEFKTIADLFSSPTTNPTNLTQESKYAENALLTWDQNNLKNPKSYGYPTVPPNWESSDDLKKHGKPTTQLFIKEFQQMVWGGVTDDRSKNTPVERMIEPYPAENTGFGVAKMEYTYWQRGLDSYTQIMEIVDEQIGRVLDGFHDLPQNIRENTVIVFTSDHGEYAGAHGLLQGKLGSIYEEAWRVPLIVVDHSKRFTGDIDTIRTGLASSVDLSTLLVSIGSNGTRDWMTRDLARIYGKRLDMIPMLKSARASGRPYVLYATDEIAPKFFNYLNAPTHVLGLRTPDAKLGVSADWFTATSKINPSTAQLEYYDYSTSRGRLELDNTATDNPRAAHLYRLLLNEIIPNELQQLLPPSLLPYQELAKIAHLAFSAFIKNLPLSVFQGQGLTETLGYGADF